MNRVYNKNLISPEEWVEPSLTIADGDELYTFHIQDLFNYHGYDAVGGVVLAFRLMQRAFRFFEKNANSPLHKRSVKLFTAFPGLGARDSFELVTRMVTDQRITVDINFVDHKAQAGVQGSFYFCFTANDQKIELAPIEGAPSDEFIRLGKASKALDATPDLLTKWTQAKFNLANTLLQTSAEDVIRIL